MRVKARRADKDDESGICRDEKGSEERITHRWATTNGRPSKFASVETKKTALRLHHLDKAEHLIRSFIGITFVCIGHIMLWLKILAPKLIDLKTALVYVKMDIALFKIGGTGFPYFGLGMQSLDRLPRAVANAFTVRFGQYKENIQVVMMRFLVNREYQATDLLTVKHNAVGFAFGVVDRFLNGFT